MQNRYAYLHTRIMAQDIIHTYLMYLCNYIGGRKLSL